MTTLFGSGDIAFGMSESTSRVQLFDGPLDLSWHHCATVSDFIADLFALRFHECRNDYKEVRHSIGYLVNELVENAVKFRAPGEITVEALMDSGNFKVRVSNRVDEETAQKFQTLLSEITASDPGELLIQRIEENAADPNTARSGLGLLTMMNDYGARLAWIFSQTEGGEKVSLDTYASLPITQTNT